jgi:uncharacterized protein YkwD
MKTSARVYFALSALIVFLLGSITIASFTTADHSTPPKTTTPGGKITIVPLTVEPIRGLEPADAQPDPETPVQPNPTPAAASPSKPAPSPLPAAAKPAAPKTQPKVATPACAGAFVDKFLCLLNQYRASKGKGRLSGNSNLSKVALAHSTWMTATGIFSHTGINGSRLGDRCRTAGITCHAENLAYNIYDPQELLNMWIASPSHNANLLGNYTTVGLGISGSYITMLLN